MPVSNKRDLKAQVCLAKSHSLMSANGNLMIISSQAIKLIDQGLALNPTYYHTTIPSLLFHRVQIHILRKEYGPANFDIARALAANPTHVRNLRCSLYFLRATMPNRNRSEKIADLAEAAKTKSSELIKDIEQFSLQLKL